jgi:hypothetical protein
MSKLLKVFILITTLLIASWFLPIIPKLNTMAFGMPGCRVVEFRDMKYFVYNQYMYNPTGKHQRPPMIPLGGNCAIIN